MLYFIFVSWFSLEHWTIGLDEQKYVSNNNFKFLYFFKENMESKYHIYLRNQNPT